MTPIADILAAAEQRKAGFRAAIPSDWMQGRTAFGGLSAALALQAALDLEPDDLVEDLGVGDRQRVEIAKVLYRGARTLILDEPTAVLVPQEVDELFGNLAEYSGGGWFVIIKTATRHSPSTGHSGSVGVLGGQ